MISVMSTIVTIAGLLTVVSLSVVLMQIKSESNECHLCGDHVSRGEKLGEMIIYIVEGSSADAIYCFCYTCLYHGHILSAELSIIKVCTF